MHVSLDVDFLDPAIAPDVGTTVRGGPTYREAQLCMEMIADTGRLASLDVVELNPALDVRNQTAEQVALKFLAAHGRCREKKRAKKREPARGGARGSGVFCRGKETHGRGVEG